jgi:hypothetical protein
MINRRSLKLSGAVLSASLLALVVPVELSVSKLPAASDVASAQEMPAMSSPCSNDGTLCLVGSKGPAGGVVFYDAGSPQWWGRYLEAKTSSVSAEGPWGSAVGKPGVVNKEIGMGRANSGLMAQDSSSVYTRKRSYFGTGASEFYLPSKDELDALYNYWAFTGDKSLDYQRKPTWTSSEASESFAWYQLFQDGTQFTDANGIIRGLKGNKDYIKSPKHVGSDFVPSDFQVIGVRAFGPTATDVNLPKTVSATNNNLDCIRAIAPVCNVGDIGPGGGIVFYDAGKTQSWGRYLEIAPKSCEGERLPWRPANNTINVYFGRSAAKSRVYAKLLGMGKINTDRIVSAIGARSHAAKFADDSVCGGKDDWFLPSKNELDIAFNRLAQNRVAGNDTPVGGFNKGYYWTSSDYNNKTAWTQYFMDGQQFDRVQTLDGNKTPPTPFRVRAVRAFG